MKILKLSKKYGDKKMSKTNIIQQIFKDHFGAFLKENGSRVRKNVIFEVNKMINCRNESKGYTKYKCPKCGEIKRVAFTCKSRFCTSCGKIYKDNWVENFVNRIINYKHKHVVFTIPEDMREIFLKERRLLEILPKSAAEVIKSWCEDWNKKEKYMPGIVAVIHTFGRDLKWNPHVHVMMTLGAIGKSGKWKKINYMPYKMLRLRWGTVLLNNLEKEIGKKKMKALKNVMYKRYGKGFYVYAKGEMKNAKEAAKYIGRYMGRPAIAESRIIKYDGQKVSFWYERHEDGKRMEETIEAKEFIGRLIRHIPEKQFKMVRNYGLYSRNHQHKRKLLKTIDEKKKEAMKKLRNWRFRIMKIYGIDPIECPNCKSIMQLEGIYDWRCINLEIKIKRREERRIYKEIKELEDTYGIIKKLGKGKIEPLFI